jgi:hypothetical protein
VRLLLPLGWVLAAIGYFGPWIAHETAGLTLSGVDMGEFVKFLPGMLDGSLLVVRQFFYLPPFAVVVSVALLIGAQRLRYPGLVRVLALILAVPVSLQLLPPAWSPATLMIPEFRLQTLALLVCWLLLAGFWLLGRLPPWLSGSISVALALAAAMLSAWQFLVVKPAIDAVYRRPPATGWGFFVCLVGLLILTTASVLFVLRSRGWDARSRGGSPWASE